MYELFFWLALYTSLPACSERGDLLRLFFICQHKGLPTVFVSPLSRLSLAFPSHAGGAHTSQRPSTKAAAVVKRRAGGGGGITKKGGHLHTLPSVFVRYKYICSLSLCLPALLYYAHTHTYRQIARPTIPSPHFPPPTTARAPPPRLLPQAPRSPSASPQRSSGRTPAPAGPAQCWGAPCGGRSRPRTPAARSSGSCACPDTAAPRTRPPTARSSPRHSTHRRPSP